MALGTGIKDGKLRYCNDNVEGNVEKKISTLEYNNRTVYDCFNIPFTADFGSPALHWPPIKIDDRSCLYKRARYTLDLLPAAIYGASENSVSTLTTPSDSPDILPSYDANTIHVMKKYVPFKGRVNRGFCYSKYTQIIC